MRKSKPQNGRRMDVKRELLQTSSRQDRQEAGGLANSITLKKKKFSI